MANIILKSDFEKQHSDLTEAYKGWTRFRLLDFDPAKVLGAYDCDVIVGRRSYGHANFYIRDDDPAAMAINLCVDDREKTALWWYRESPNVKYKFVGGKYAGGYGEKQEIPKKKRRIPTTNRLFKMKDDNTIWMRAYVSGHYKIVTTVPYEGDRIRYFEFNNNGTLTNKCWRQINITNRDWEYLNLGSE